MNKETVTVVFNMIKRNIVRDIQIPIYITANELIVALNEAYSLNIDTSNVKNCYLKAEKPIALLKGNKTLAEFGVRNGTVIIFTE